MTTIWVSPDYGIQCCFRQTRAMTMAQFFEIRYRRGIRITSGLLCFMSGTLNFAIFPAVDARFLQHFYRLGSYFIGVLAFVI
jgi:solute:Na+ symporter, SSS family